MDLSNLLGWYVVETFSEQGPAYVDSVHRSSCEPLKVMVDR